MSTALHRRIDRNLRRTKALLIVVKAKEAATKLENEYADSHRKIFGCDPDLSECLFWGNLKSLAYKAGGWPMVELCEEIAHEIY